MQKKGQISLEYMITVGFIIFLIIGILGIGIFYSGLIKDRIRINNLKNFANKIISSSESVYYAGEPSLTTVNVYLPSGVQHIFISGNEIIFNITTSGGISVISYSGNVPLDGSLSNSEGAKKVRIVAYKNNATITEIS